VAAAVLDGRLYVAGGFGLPRGTQSRAFEAFDPATSTWAKLAPLPEARDHAGLTAIGGRLYLTGGNGEGFQPRPNLWIYDASKDHWSAGPPMPDRRSAHGAVAADGRLYLVGGVIPSQTFRAPTWCYDPTSGTWTDNLAAIPTYREHVAAVVVDGTIIAVGGRAATDLAAVERYEPATDTWTSLPPLPTARGGLTAAVLDNAIHAIGGESIDAPRVFAQHEILNLATLTWSAGPPLARGRHGLGSAVIGGRLYVAAGGANPDLAVSDKLDIFTP
jgi:N-acetylneuraminic acid mutarotase